MSAKTIGRIQRTSRGFEFIEFIDRQGEACSLQVSSLADYVQPGTSAIWLGLDSATAGSARMHLDREQVAALVSHLAAWLETGSLIVRRGKS